MIKNLFFDFGAVLLPIKESLSKEAFKSLGALDSLAEQKALFESFEVGAISEEEFLAALQPHFFRKKIFKGDLKAAWNAWCYAPIPAEHIALLKNWRKDYRLFLLSNTNALHIQHIRKQSGLFTYQQFLRQFEQVYYSHEIGLRKPDPAFYLKVLEDHQLEPEECFFIDDKEENVLAATELGIHTWHFKPKKDKLQDLGRRLKSI